MSLIELVLREYASGRAPKDWMVINETGVATVPRYRLVDAADELQRGAQKIKLLRRALALLACVILGAIAGMAYHYTEHQLVNPPCSAEVMELDPTEIRAKPSQGVWL